MASSVSEVRQSPGGKYFVDPVTRILTIRVISFSGEFVGNPDWTLPTYETPGRNEVYALKRFERNGVLLPSKEGQNIVAIEANICGGAGRLCSKRAPTTLYDPDVCDGLAGFEQTAYDACCNRSGSCVYADGSRNY